MNDTDKKQLCRGCRDDFYNQPGNSQCGHCWSLDTATVVIRYRIGWWTSPATPGAYTKVKTLSCHYAPGSYALHEQPAECNPDRERLLAQKV